MAYMTWARSGAPKAEGTCDAVPGIRGYFHRHFFFCSFDPSKLKDAKVDKFLQNMQMCSKLASQGFNPKAEAKKGENQCRISFPNHYG